MGNNRLYPRGDAVIRKDFRALAYFNFSFSGGMVGMLSTGAKRLNLLVKK